METRLKIRVKRDVVILPTISDLAIGNHAYVTPSNMKVVDIDAQQWEVIFNENASISYFGQEEADILIHKNQDGSIDVSNIPIMPYEQISKKQFTKLLREGWIIIDLEEGAKMLKILDPISQYAIIMTAKSDGELLSEYFEKINQEDEMQKEFAKVLEDIFVARVKQMSYTEIIAQLGLFNDELTAYLEEQGEIPDEEDIISLSINYPLFNNIQEIMWHKMPIPDLKKLRDGANSLTVKKYFADIIAARMQN